MTGAALRARLREARDVLDDAGRAAFRPGRLALDERRLYSDDGLVALEWRERRWPDRPVSYENQQTSRGSVFLVAAEGGA